MCVVTPFSLLLITVTVQDVDSICEEYSGNGESENDLEMILEIIDAAIQIAKLRKAYAVRGRRYRKCGSY